MCDITNYKICSQNNTVVYFSCDTTCTKTFYDVQNTIYEVFIIFFALMYFVFVVHKIINFRNKKIEASYQMFGIIICCVSCLIRSLQFGFGTYGSDSTLSVLSLRIPQLLGFGLILIKTFIWCNALGIFKKGRYVVWFLYVLVSSMLLFYLHHNKNGGLLLGILFIFFLGYGVIIGFTLIKNIHISQTITKHATVSISVKKEFNQIFLIKQNIIKAIIPIWIGGLLILVIAIILQIPKLSYLLYLSIVSTYHLIELFIYQTLCSKVFVLEKKTKNKKKTVVKNLMLNKIIPKP